ncbi:hypothetical protein [Elioraea sp.]|uniref:hypothetical protein n=1 Tax=Elioraea sp. TaxID=2185103 RepID=UPI0025C4AA03|nr:hypothetical protein [Elioraea sp.]
MASPESYILFSQTSRPFGTRDLWGPEGLPGGIAGSVPGLINGIVTDVPLSAFDAFQGTEFVRGDWALFDLVAAGQSATSAALTGAIDAAAVTADGRVFVAPPGPRNPQVAFDADPSGGVSIVLADRDWNGIKNVEVFLTNAALVYDGPEPDVFIRNVVDVRVKLGDSLVTEEGPPRYASIVIENVKRGEIDAAELGQLHATVSFASNGEGWGNTFVIKGNGSSITLLPGDWAGGTTALDGFRNIVNDGSLTHVVVTMAGDSSFDARAVKAMTDVRAGEDAGFLYVRWDGIGYDASDAGDALSVTFDALAARIDLGLHLALPGPVPALGPVTLWRDGVVIETVNPAFVETVLDVDPGTGEQRLIVTVDWLASRSFDTMTIEGLGSLGAPVAEFGGAFRPRSIVIAETPGRLTGSDGSGSLLVAGPGVNVFRYAYGDNVDTIWNFERGQDVLVLEAAADARIFETEDGTVVLFDSPYNPPYDPPIDERNGITLVGVRDLAIGTDIIFA